MLDKGQIFTRAINKEGKWAAVDVLNLTEESFKRFVLAKLNTIGVVCIVRDTRKEEESEPLREKIE